MRAPGDFQGMIFTESAVEAAITAGSFDEIALKNANLGAEVQPVWLELDKRMGGQTARKAAVEQFNQKNRWRKRGIWSMPVKYGRGNHEREMVSLEIAEATGVVTVSASGIEMGQGLNTKVAQAVALGLGKLSASVSVPLSMIQNTGVKTTASFPAASGTSGSGTSESCCDAALKACAKVVKLLAPYARPGLDWAGVVRAAAAGGVKLSAQVEGQHLSGGEYYIYAAGATEVELDVLTGEYEILRTDIVYDSGISLNPALDIGQVEGCYVMAAGMCLTEFQSHSKIDGRLIGAGTWDYKPPCSLDIPLEFNIWFAQTANNVPGNVLGSKCATEPAMPLGAGAFFALKQAIYAAREDATGKPREYFPMPLPATPAHVQPLCLVDLSKG
jgi:xanthine dehydrogenase/oxidase